MIWADQEAVGQGIAPDQKRLGNARYFQQAQFNITDNIAQDQLRSDHGCSYRGAVGASCDLSEGPYRHGKTPCDLSLDQLRIVTRCAVDSQRKGYFDWRGCVCVTGRSGTAFGFVIGFLDRQVANEKAALRGRAKDHRGQGRNSPIGQIDRFIGIKDGAIAQATIPPGGLCGRCRFAVGCKHDQGFVQCRVHAPLTVHDPACDRLVQENNAAGITYCGSSHHTAHDGATDDQPERWLPWPRQPERHECQHTDHGGPW